MSSPPRTPKPSGAFAALRACRRRGWRLPASRPRCSGPPRARAARPRQDRGPCGSGRCIDTGTGLAAATASKWATMPSTDGARSTAPRRARRRRRDLREHGGGADRLRRVVRAGPTMTRVPPRRTRARPRRWRPLLVGFQRWPRRSCRGRRCRSRRRRIPVAQPLDRSDVDHALRVERRDQRHPDAARSRSLVMRQAYFSDRSVPGDPRRGRYVPGMSLGSRSRSRARRRRDRRAVGHVRDRRRGRLHARDPRPRRHRAQAIGSTLPSILPSSISGSLRYQREEFIRLRSSRSTVRRSRSVAGSRLSGAVPGNGRALMVLTASSSRSPRRTAFPTRTLDRAGLPVEGRVVAARADRCRAARSPGCSASAAASSWSRRSSGGSACR